MRKSIDNEVLEAIFEVKTTDRGIIAMSANAVVYNSVSRGSAADRLRVEVARELEVPITAVTFKFWADRAESLRTTPIYK